MTHMGRDAKTLLSAKSVARWEAEGVTPTARALLWRCGACELDESRAPELRALGTSLPEDAWQRFLGLAHAAGMEALAFKQCARADLLLVMPSAVAEALGAAYRQNLVTNRWLQGEHQAILRALAAEGIDVLVVKGLALAARYYGEIALRPVRDIDLVLKSSDLPPALQTLSTLGYQPDSHQGRVEDFEARHHAEVALRKPDGPTVEVRWELARPPAYWCAFDMATIWARAQTITIATIPVRYLDPADELRYLSCHYAVQHHCERLIWLVDIARLVAALPADWDWDRFIAETTALRVATPVAITLLQARVLLGLSLPAHVLVQLLGAASSRAERAEWRLAHAHPFDPLRLLRHIQGIPTWSERADYLAGWLQLGGTLARTRTHPRATD